MQINTCILAYVQMSYFLEYLLQHKKYIRFIEDYAKGVHVL